MLTAALLLGCGAAAPPTADVAAGQDADAAAGPALDGSPLDQPGSDDGQPQDAAAGVDAADLADVASVSDAGSGDSTSSTPSCVLAAPPAVAAPGLLTSEAPGQLLARLDKPPLQGVWQDVQARAQQANIVVQAYPDSYVLANIAKAKALVGWLKADLQLTQQALAAVAKLPAPSVVLTDPNAGIHVGDALVGFGVALHLSEASSPTDALLPAAQAQYAAWCSAFYQWTTADLALAYAFWPNNHSEKAAAGLGMCALVLPKHPAAAAWQGWASATVRDIWEMYGYAPSGSYAEGPYYHMYAQISLIPWLVASHRGQPKGICGQVLCKTRAAWHPGCVDHLTPVSDLLQHPLLLAGITWAVDFLRPDGLFWPWGDALPAGFPFGALAGPLHHAGAAWAFDKFPFASWTADLGVETLLFSDPQLVGQAPTASWRFDPDGGLAMWRTGQGAGAGQVGLIAVPPPFQWAGHRHADALHVEVFAMGKPRLLDAGYSKWDDHELVNKAEQHNTVFVDGKGPVVPMLFGKVIQPCELLQGNASGGSARATLGPAVVVREVLLLTGGEIRVTDSFTLSDTATHEVGLRWQGLGGLTAAEDPRGLFVQDTDGAHWSDGEVSTWVQVSAPGGQKLQLGSDLQHDGLAYGVIKSHRALWVKAQGQAKVTLVSRLWVGAASGKPPWQGK